MSKAINLHKKLAMGATQVSEYKRGGAVVKGYARGGSVSKGTVGSSVPAIAVTPSGRAANPLTAAKQTNGIPGLKRGGSVKK
jgi:hypothetical protein